MGFVRIFEKSVMKNAYLPKISILLQFGGEILALLCPSDSIQILLILSQFQTLRTGTKLEGFCNTLELYILFTGWPSRDSLFIKLTNIDNEKRKSEKQTAKFKAANFQRVIF